MSNMMSNYIPIFVINLPQSTDRKAFMQAQCETIGVEPTFIDAVNGKDLTDIEIHQYCDQEKAKQLFGRELLLGEIGCALSHKKIYKKMVDDNIQLAVVLEDDARIEYNFAKVISDICQSSTHWDLVLLGHHKNIVKNLSSPLSIWDINPISSEYKLCRLVNFGFGTYGYIVTLKGAKKLLAELTTIYKPIDHYIPDSCVLNVYALHPVVVSVNPEFDTLIDSGKVRQKDNDRLLVMFLEKLGIFDLAVSVKSFIKKLKPIKRYR